MLHIYFPVTVINFPHRFASALVLMLLNAIIPVSVSGAKSCSRHALFQFCYSFFTLAFDMLTGKNGGDIINLNSRRVLCVRFEQIGIKVGLLIQGIGVARLYINRK